MGTSRDWRGAAGETSGGAGVEAREQVRCATGAAATPLEVAYWGEVGVKVVGRWGGWMDLVTHWAGSTLGDGPTLGGDSTLGGGM